MTTKRAVWLRAGGLGGALLLAVLIGGAVLGQPPDGLECVGTSHIVGMVVEPYPSGVYTATTPDAAVLSHLKENGTDALGLQSEPGTESELAGRFKEAPTDTADEGSRFIYEDNAGHPISEVFVEATDDGHFFVSAARWCAQEEG